MSVRYNSEVLQEYADRLYQMSRTATFLCGIVFGGLGAVVGVGFVYSEWMAPHWIIIVCMVGLGLLGYFFGHQLTFWFRFRAQFVLCQAQIEQRLNNLETHLGGAEIARLQMDESHIESKS